MVTVHGINAHRHLVPTPPSRGESFHTANSSRRSTTSRRSNLSVPDAEALAMLIADLEIEPWEEDEFAWIAEVGLQTPPPPRWASRYDVENGATYFVDTDTQTSTWENPLAPHLKKVVEVGRLYLKNPLDTSVFEEKKRMLWAEHKAELESWHGPMTDDDGNSYFVSSTENISSWQDPRIGAQYIFDVQCGLMRHLAGILAAAEEQDAPGFGVGTPWETEDGAQVMTLDSLGIPVSWTPAQKVARVARTMSMPEDHTFVLQQMGSAADWLHESRQNEEEVQRLRLIRKVEERRVRTLSQKLSKAIHDTVQGGVEEDERCQERRIAWATTGKL